MHHYDQPHRHTHSTSSQECDVGLFVMWERARSHEGEILEEIRRRFEIRALHEVHWSRDRVAENFSRFYRGRLSPPFRTGLQQQKGGGPFLAVVVADRNPSHGERATPAGPRLVNTDMHDMKVRMREWLEEPFSLHSSDNGHTASRELVLLFGRGPEHWRGRDTHASGDPEAWNDDLIASDGWPSLAAMYHALGAATTYVDLDGAFGPVIDERESRPIRLLTNELKEVLSVLAARPRHRYSSRGSCAYTITIGERPVSVDVHTVEDGYLDPKWAAELIKRRVATPSGVFRPDPEMIFDLELYRAVVHRRQLQPEELRSLQAAARMQPGIDADDLSSPSGRERLLRGVLDRCGFNVTRPRDPEIPFNYAFSGAPLPMLRTGLSEAGWRIERAVGSATVAPLRTAALTTRERLLTRFPRMRTLESRLRP
jgi:hypothetical protein